jgi:hypothetical protein
VTTGTAPRRTFDTARRDRWWLPPLATGLGLAAFGVGVGSLVLLANAILLSLFTFGCNSLRHLAGGKLDCFTCSARARARHRVWRGVGVLNARHMEWAWLSLVWVGLADLYVRLAAGGAFDDPRII